MALTYTSYLKVDELLTLQEPLSDGPEHDELLFIVIHQVYELWFKQVLHEVDHLQRGLESGNQPQALHTLKRIRTILKTMVSQVDILETMTPIQFESFRHRLQASSGFQSVQFRAFEIALGKRNEFVLSPHAAGTEARAMLEERLTRPTVYQSFLTYLSQEGYVVPKEALAPQGLASTDENEEVQAILLEIYRQAPALSQICELLVDLDEGVQEWRYRHVKMVERTIGAKIGTGGSAGAEYLRKTLFTPLFPDLWTIRSKF